MTTTTWSTRDVGPRQAMGYWNELLSDKVLRLDISSRAGWNFHGSITGADLGRGRVYLIAADDDQDAAHDHASVAQRTDDALCLVHMRSGAFHLRTAARETHLLIGDSVLLDSKQLFRFSLPAASSSLVLRFTSGWLRRWIPHYEDVAGRRLDGSTGWGQTLSHALWNIDPAHVDQLALPGSAVADQVGGLLALASAPASAPGTHCHALVHSIRAALRERCHETDLAPPAIAAQFGISKRYLHKLLAGAGTTFGATLYALRLDEAERLLTHPRATRLSITEIAYACGFCDASHFARHFRARHRMSPGAWRQAPTR